MEIVELRLVVHADLVNAIGKYRTQAVHRLPLPCARERFHKTILQEFYQVTFRKKIYETIEQLQNDLDEWIDHYNNERTHQGKICEGRTPMQTLEEGKAIWREKFVAGT